jgi:hypothetical protein
MTLFLASALFIWFSLATWYTLALCHAASGPMPQPALPRPPSFSV